MTFVRLCCIVILLVCLPVCSGIAQTDDCEATLGRAVDAFNAGHFYAIPAILDECIPQFSREQRQRAYLLLTQTYLLLDDPIGARQSYLQILDANPEFVADPAIHSVDVIYLGKRFTATSIFSWFGKAGINYSIARVIHDLDAFGAPASERYYLRTGYQVGGGADLTLTEKGSLRAELQYSVSSYRHVSTDYFQFDRKVYDERQNWFTMPVTMVYSDVLGKYRPYGYLGYALHYLAGNRSEITLTNDKPDLSSDIGERELSTETSPGLSTVFKRNRFNQSILAGAGLKIKVGLDFLFIDLRYAFGLRNIVSDENLYGDYARDPLSADFVDSMESSMRFSHVDDFFRLDNLSVSLGFLRPLYQPRELKRARTRSLMRQMR